MAMAMGSGFPQPQVKEELMTVWEQVSFEADLELRGVALSSEELQLSLKGNVVGSGIIQYDEFLKRIEGMYSILSRTIQRKLKREYQRSGRLADIYKYYTPALTVPSAGSFSITFRLTLPTEHQIVMFLDAKEVIDEIITGVEFINNGEETKLQELVGEEAYYLNFISQTRKMAPDGNNINLVGLNSNRRGVVLTRQNKNISLVPRVGVPEQVKFRRMAFKGILDYAKSRKEDVLGLTTEDNRNWYVHVREGMDDFVRSYFDQKVIITGEYDIRYKRIYLEDIQPAED